MKCILDAKYSKDDIKTIAESSTHLDPQERNELYTILKKYERLFDGNLGTWNGKPYDIKLKLDVEPYHGKPFPVPRIDAAIPWRDIYSTAKYVCCAITAQRTFQC